MKKLAYFLWLAVILSVITAGNCRKNKGGNGNTIDIETSPASGSNQPPSVGPNFPLVITIKSAMPDGGVKIEVSARPEGSTTPFYTNSIVTSNASNTFSITNTPVAVSCVVEITVTGVNNAGLRATATYRYSRK